MPGVSIRLLAPGDEGVVRELATSDGPGDPEALLADSRTPMLVAFDGARPVGFVLAHERNPTTARRTRCTAPRAARPTP